MGGAGDDSPHFQKRMSLSNTMTLNIYDDFQRKNSVGTSCEMSQTLVITLENWFYVMGKVSYVLM